MPLFVGKMSSCSNIFGDDRAFVDLSREVVIVMDFSRVKSIANANEYDKNAIFVY